MTDLNRLLQLSRDFAQGASNSAASNVSMPIDGIAYLLKQAGVPMNDAVGGSDWMRSNGLTADPQNQLAGSWGESFGSMVPLAAIAKARQPINALEAFRLMQGGK